MNQPPFNSYQLPNQIQSNNNNNNNNNNNAAPLNPQVLLNLCNMLHNSVPMQQQQQPPQLGIMNPQIPIPFNNSNTLLPNISPFITQQYQQQQQQQQPPVLHHQLGFSSHNHLTNFCNPVPMFANQFNPSQPQQFPFNFPQNINQNLGFPNLQNPIQLMNPALPVQLPHLSQLVAPQNPTFLPNPQHLPSFNQQQGNPVNNNAQNNTSNSERNKFPNKNFRKNPKQEPSNSGYQKSHFHRMNNGKRKFDFSNERKGHGYEKATKSGRTIPTEQAGQKKRSYTLIYTEQEIKRWCEERRKNFPSKANIEKKRSERRMNSGDIDKEAKQRREQLKEILAQQAELGVEVAELPPHYLSDSKNQVKEKEHNRSSTQKKGRHWNKHAGRGRYNKRDRWAKNNTLANKDSLDISSSSERKPTLLEKLLTADIRNDKHRLLQAFRFIVMNSFFEDMAEKPLKFPSVILKEDEVAAEKPSSFEKGVSEAGNKTAGENFGHASDSDEGEDGADDENEDKNEAPIQQGMCHAKEKGSLDGVARTEEEGEIID